MADYKTVDLARVLAGIDFPVKEFPVLFNERGGYEMYAAEQELKTAELRDDNKEHLKNVQEKLDTLREAVKDQLVTVTIKGVPENTRRACDAKSRAKFPVSYSILNQEEPDPARAEYYHTLLWAASIVKITLPGGEVFEPSDKDIEELRRQLGRSAVATITGAIDELITGVTAGFEETVKDPDFLSESSLEG